MDNYEWSLIISKQPRSFAKRVFNEMLWIEWFVLLLIFIFFYKEEIIALILAGIVQVIFLYNALRKEKYHLVSVTIINSCIRLYGFKNKSNFEYEFLLEKIHIKLKPIFKKGPFSYRVELIEKNSNELILYQYLTKDFDFGQLRSLFLEIRERQGTQLSSDEKRIFKV